MKIQVLKKGDSKIKHNDSCPWLVEVPPEPTRK
jgi:hypothetical protein